MAKRLVIDLYKCDACEACEVECAAFHRAKASDHGVLTLRELATFSLVCRRCEDASCVAACRFEALERQEDGILARHNMRCVSCKCCAQACPFGTIYADALPFYVTNCDFCTAIEGEVLPCVPSCKQDALEYREVDDAEEGLALVGNTLAVKAPAWEKEKV